MRFEASLITNPAEWDDFVSTAASGHFMQSHAWGAFQLLNGWDSHYLLWRDDTVICATALLLSRKMPLISARIFYAPRGPIMDFTDRAAVFAAENDIRAYLAREKGVFLRTEPYINSSEITINQNILPGSIQVSRDWSYWNAPKLVLWLDLQGSEDDVFMRMTSRCRNDVRRGYRNDVTFSTGGEEDLEAFYRLMTMTGLQKGIAVHNIDHYRKLCSTVNSSAQSRLFLGRHAGEVITAGISIKYGKKAWLMYAASTPESYKLRANRTLQWEMIKWAKAQGCERYDFRGTACSDPPNPEDPGYGVYEFKKSFGPEYVRLVGYYDLVTRPTLYRLFRFAEEKLLPVAYRVRTWLKK
jgi:lipid II:glycine glycyltransferase (peptidoglycan interpeptide bridge formation enzyme)